MSYAFFQLCRLNLNAIISSTLFRVTFTHCFFLTDLNQHSICFCSCSRSTRAVFVFYASTSFLYLYEFAELLIKH